MVNITKNISRIATAVMVVKTGYEIYQTTKTVSTTLSSFTKGKKNVKKASVSASKVLSAIKKGILEDKKN